MNGNLPCDDLGLGGEFVDDGPLVLRSDLILPQLLHQLRPRYHHLPSPAGRSGYASGSDRRPIARQKQNDDEIRRVLRRN